MTLTFHFCADFFVLFNFLEAKGNDYSTRSKANEQWFFQLRVLRGGFFVAEIIGLDLLKIDVYYKWISQKNWGLGIGRIIACFLRPVHKPCCYVTIFISWAYGNQL